MGNGGKCVSGGFGEVFLGQGVVLKFCHLVFDIIHFIICMGCLLHDFRWEKKWVKGPENLKGFRFDQDTVVRVNCTIEES